MSPHVPITVPNQGRLRVGLCDTVSACGDVVYVGLPWLSRAGISEMPLGKRTDCGDAKYAGVEVSFACDVVEVLEVLTGAHVTSDCRARRFLKRHWHRMV